MRRLALIAVLGALAAGCGGEETVSPTAQTVEGTPPPAPQPQAQGEAAAGKNVFVAKGCGGCHVFTPAGAQAKGTTGPNLGQLAQFAEKAGQPLDEFARESVENPDAYVEEGFPSGVMPPWSGTEKELADLVAFLSQGA